MAQGLLLHGRQVPASPAHAPMLRVLCTARRNVALALEYHQQPLLRLVLEQVVVQMAPGPSLLASTQQTADKALSPWQLDQGLQFLVKALTQLPLALVPTVFQPHRWQLVDLHMLAAFALLQ